MRKQKKSMLVLAIITAFVATGFFLPKLIGAGELEPSAPPGPTMKTLDEIYEKIGSLVAGNGGLQPSRFDQQSVVHMEIEGINQGPIQGSCTLEGLQETIPVVGLEQQINIPTDPGSGQPAGRRIHGPLSVIKYVDRSTPKLFQALGTGEHLQVTLKWYGLDPAGAVEHFFTITLDHAMIVTMKPYFPNFEGVSFIYNKIKWTWEPDGIEFEDSWAAP